MTKVQFGRALRMAAAGTWPPQGLETRLVQGGGDPRNAANSATRYPPRRCSPAMLAGVDTAQRFTVIGAG